MNKKEQIIILYFEKGFNTIQIAEQLNVSKQYVSKVVRNDNRHQEETERRKSNNRLKQIERNKQCIKNKRKKNNDIRLNAILELQHNQATSELSGRKSINNRAFRNWNTSIYRFNERTKEYQVKKEFINKTSYAIPKKIKWS